MHTRFFGRQGRCARTVTFHNDFFKALATMLLACCGAAYAAPPISLDAGQQFPLMLDRAIEQAAIGDPEVADVQLV